MNAIHAVLVFLGALPSGRGCRLYRLFSLPLVADGGVESLSRADGGNEVWSPVVPSGSGRDSDIGMPR
jgi:hypothetical protein